MGIGLIAALLALPWGFSGFRQPSGLERISPSHEILADIDGDNAPDLMGYFLRKEHGTVELWVLRANGTDHILATMKADQRALRSKLDLLDDGGDHSCPRRVAGRLYCDRPASRPHNTRSIRVTEPDSGQHVWRWTGGPGRMGIERGSFVRQEVFR